MNRHRIDLLDSFRFLAVISVVLYHFTFRWKFLVPDRFYGNFFSYGLYGVQLFFVISGFVISYTLENTANWRAFIKNRFIRLFPPLLLCTLITFVVTALFDKNNLLPFAHTPINFLPSLTLITPSIWTLLWHRDFYWINGSYASLWVEIQFYVLAGTIYFLSKANFLRNMLLTTVVLSCMKYMPGFLLYERVIPQSIFKIWKFTDEVLNIFFSITWFGLGVIFYYLYKRSALWRKPFLCRLALLVLVFLYWDRFVRVSWEIHLCVALLFGLLIWKKEYLKVLNIPIFRRIGRISYFIFLIHEVVGILLLIHLGPGFNWSPVLPLLVIAGCILFAELSWRFYEKPVSRWLKRKLFQQSPQVSAEYFNGDRQQNDPKKLPDSDHSGRS